MAVIGFIDLCEKLDPAYDWVEALLERELKPAQIVGFSIEPVGEKWVVTFGDMPVALLHQENREWVVMRYWMETGTIQEVPGRSRNIAPTLDKLLDVMLDFRAAYDIHILREKVRAQTRKLNEINPNRQ